VRTAELETVFYKLNEVLKVFGKPLDPSTKNIWAEVFHGKPIDVCLEALQDVASSREYAPKPTHVIEAIRLRMGEQKTDYVYKGSDEQTRKALEEGNERVASPEVTTAWLKVMRLELGHTGFAPPSAREKEIEMNIETAVRIVNQQASKYSCPDALSDQVKLQEFWPNE
jgi:hypothetical protein